MRHPGDSVVLRDGAERFGVCRGVGGSGLLRIQLRVRRRRRLRILEVRPRNHVEKYCSIIFNEKYCQIKEITAMTKNEGTFKYVKKVTVNYSQLYYHGY